MNTARLAPALGTATRPAAVAGSFYPAQPQALRTAVTQYLDAAPPGQGPPPKLLVVPHAGYVYSGAMAARAYTLLRAKPGSKGEHRKAQPEGTPVTRVVLLGPVHRVAVQGLAAPTVQAFATPLGTVPLDLAALAGLRGLPQVVFSDAPHAQEHSLEVQLPFLQISLGPFKLVPLAVGDASPQAVAQVLQQLWGGPETLVVISSDLSHYLPYEQAQAMDQATVQRIEDLATDLHPRQACGARALNGALLLAARLGMQVQRLGLCNSGDTAGPRERVVGYAALAVREPASAATADDGLGAALLGAARNAINQRLGLPAKATPDHPALQQPGASFVTLHDAQGKLRGCIGTLAATRPLLDDVRHHAVAAAFNDPRFAPLKLAEWPGIELEVSLLDAPQPVQFTSDAQACLVLRPGVDGLSFEWQGHRSTFLPQVWQQLPDVSSFLGALKRKAGLPEGFWAADMRWQRYGVRVFSEGKQ